MYHCTYMHIEEPTKTFSYLSLQSLEGQGNFTCWNWLNCIWLSSFQYHCSSLFLIVITPVIDMGLRTICLVGISRTHKQLCGHGQTSSKCKGGGHKCGSCSECIPQIHVLRVLGPESYLPRVWPVLASFSSFCGTENQHVCLKLRLLSIVIWEERLLLMKVAN